MQNYFKMLQNCQSVAVTTTHLEHLVPLGIDSLMDDFALEELCPNLDDSIWIRLSFNQPPKELVLP